MSDQIRIPDLTYQRIGDNIVRLEQSIGCGETVLVDLHRIHVALLAEQMGILRRPPADDLLRFEVETLRRRLRDIHDKTHDLHDDEKFFNQILDRLDDGAQAWAYIVRIVEACDVAVEDIAAMSALSEKASPQPEEDERRAQPESTGQLPLIGNGR